MIHARQQQQPLPPPPPSPLVPASNNSNGLGGGVVLKEPTVASGGGGGGSSDVTLSCSSSILTTTTSNESGSNTLTSLIQSYDWPGALARIQSHPHETRILEQPEGRTPLHLACEQDAPAVVIQSLLKAFPEASIQVTSSNMTPLHVTCSSSHASVHVIRVLLELGVPQQCSMRDLDGDTPLHAACRCGASIEVLEVLLLAHPEAVHQRDYEGLTPLLRLWVRTTVILGEDVLECVSDAADLTGELGEAWKKTELLLKCAHLGSLEQNKQPPQHHQGHHRGHHHHDASTFRVVHAASAVDCPRAVVRIASTIYPHQLEEKDELGRTPLMLAAKAPVFKVRDLSDEGYSLEDVIHGDESSDADKEESDDFSSTPSVIELLLQANQELAGSASNVPDNRGRLPLHVALCARKRMNNGVKALVENYPDALAIPHPQCHLYAFQLAAEGDRGDLNTTYELLRLNPSVVEEIVQGKHKKATNTNRAADTTTKTSELETESSSDASEPVEGEIAAAGVVAKIAPNVSKKCSSVASLVNLADKAAL
jgi:ankyrin repeat protein